MENPISAHKYSNGTSIPDLLLLLVQWTQKTMEKKLVFVSEVQCTVLEVKVIEGLGTTVDVVLINGFLHERDQIVVCGLQGPIVTTIRALLTTSSYERAPNKGMGRFSRPICLDALV